MVKRITLIFLFILSLVSCEFFLQTPFPEELTYWGNSIPIEGIGLFHETKLYIVDEEYIFLYIDQQESNNKIYIFEQDPMKLIYTYDTNDMDPGLQCDTFAMKESNGYYFIGNVRFDIIKDGENTVVNIVSTPNLEEGTNNPRPPSGYGFSHNSLNYLLWWNENDGYRSLQYTQYVNDWNTKVFSDSLSLTDYDRLKAMYYHENPGDSTSGKVILFFESHGNIDVVTIPADNFASELSTYYINPPYFDEYSVTLDDVDANYCYYTGDGYVIREHGGSQLRFSTSGKLEKEINSGEDDYTEAYSSDGKTRYIFSERYLRLMKAPVWW